MAERVGAGALGVVGLLFLWRSLALPLGDGRNPGPGAAPLLLALVLIGAASWTALVRPSASPPDLDEAGADRAEWRHAVAVVAAAAFAALAIGSLGYRLTILAVLVALIGLVERKPLLPTLLIAFALSFGSYWLFVRVVRIPLPAGPWGF
jgi:Tripartite tricarboxylate transporter TctB family